MVYCSNCGKENPEDARFCDGCGYQIANAPAQDRAIQDYPSNQPYVRSDHPQQYPSYGPPTPTYKQVQPHGYGEVGKKKGWVQEHIGESRIYYCPKDGCGWSGTKAEMKYDFNWSYAPQIPVNIGDRQMLIESYKEIGDYSCPRCGTFIKSKTTVKPLSMMGKPDSSSRDALFLIAFMVILISLVLFLIGAGII